MPFDPPKSAESAEGTEAARSAAVLPPSDGQSHSQRDTGEPRSRPRGALAHARTPAPPRRGAGSAGGIRAAGEHRSLAEELARAISGEVRFDAGSRGLYATDASNYRQAPVGLVLPRNSDDVLTTLELCRAHKVAVLGRGGGTSLAGQCCNEAVVLDFSRYMDEIIEIDPKRRIARVQPGVVLDDLNREARKYGLVYPPDPATHSHCTLGGMIGNNSCGVHSVMSEFYGPGSRTSDHVLELDVVTYDGVRMRVGETSDEALADILAAGGQRAAIYAAMRDLRDTYSPLIRERFSP